MGHGGQVGELLALAAGGDGSDDVDSAEVGLLGVVGDEADHLGGVDAGSGVGHDSDGSKSAADGSPRTGEDGLGLLAAGLTDLHVQVNLAGSYQQALGFDSDVCGSGDLAKGGYSIVLNEQVGRDSGAASGVDSSAVFD